MTRLWLRRIFGVAYVSVLLTLAGIGLAVASLSPCRPVNMVPFGLLFFAAMVFLLIRRRNRG
jgi:hypothetical protein